MRIDIAKSVPYMILLVALLAVAGCSGDEPADPAAAAEPVAAEEPTPVESEGPANDEAMPSDDPAFSSAEAIGMTFAWRIDGEELEVELTGPTTGWIAVGLKPSRMMRDANILIGYVNGSQVVMEDHFGTTMTAHRADESLGGTTDLEILSGEERDGSTTIRFRIPLDSGDEYDQPLSAGETIRVILAYGPNGANDTASYHSARGGVDVTL